MPSRTGAPAPASRNGADRRGRQHHETWPGDWSSARTDRRPLRCGACHRSSTPALGRSAAAPPPSTRIRPGWRAECRSTRRAHSRRRRRRSGLRPHGRRRCWPPSAEESHRPVGGVGVCAGLDKEPHNLWAVREVPRPVGDQAQRSLVFSPEWCGRHERVVGQELAKPGDVTAVNGRNNRGSDHGRLITAKVSASRHGDG
jgi:hypothetical protein